MMKRILLILILAGSLPGYGCGGGASHVTPAGPSTATASVRRLPKIVAMGDSLTAGFGLPQSQSYPTLLQKRLEADGLQYEIVNAGVSGDTSAGGLRRLDWVLQDDVKIVILELGANDILAGQPLADMRRNLGQIIERIKARGARVLLAGLEPSKNSDARYRKEIQDVFQQLASEHKVALIPSFLEGVVGVPTLNQGDGIHPNADGTRIVAETVYRALVPLLRE